jgi:hypothetical protein
MNIMVSDDARITDILDWEETLLLALWDEHSDYSMIDGYNKCDVQSKQARSSECQLLEIVISRGAG